MLVIYNMTIISYNMMKFKNTEIKYFFINYIQNKPDFTGSTK